MAFGSLDVAGITLGTGIDSAVLRRQALRDGGTFEQVLRLAETYVNTFNAAVDPMIGNVTALVTDRAVRVPQDSMAFGAASEYTKPDPQRLTAEGWMLKRVQEDLGLRMTWLWLRDKIIQDVENNLRAVINAARDSIRYNVLKKLFSDTEEGVESGYCPGVAGAFSAVTYTPPKYGGSTFLSTHSHLNRANGLDDCAAANSADLQEHGKAAPYIHYVSSANRASWIAETNFVKRVVGPIQAETDVDRAVGELFNYRPLDTEFIGYCEDGFVVPITHIPTNYTATVQQLGLFSPDNPVAVMLPPEGVSLMMRPDVDVMTDGLIFFIEFYVGVRDPSGAAVALNGASGSYAAPTIAR